MDGGEDKPDSDIEYYGLSDFDRYRADQVAWLKETVASEAFRTAPFKVAIIHVPPVNSTWHGRSTSRSISCRCSTTPGST